MPSWGEILNELRAPGANLDAVRRGYISKLAKHTGRNTVLYATAWTNPKGAGPDTLSITEEDIQGFMAVIAGIKGDDLDLILHTPGGSPVATEGIVRYLRRKFKNIRVLIPQSAMSAGTMLACAANSIIMGKHSFLGPIDPQFIIQTSQGLRAVPARAILEQFEMAQAQCKNPANLATWMPILSQYGPGLLVECKNAEQLSRRLVRDWLAAYMFHGQKRGPHKAAIAAKHLASHKKHMSHGRHIGSEELRQLGFHIDDLEADPTLQDLLLSVFHATTITLDATPAAKILENHHGKAFLKLRNVNVPLPLPQRPPEGPGPGKGQPPTQPA